MKRGDFPIQRECDLKKPSEAFVWMLVALPHMKGAALPMSSEYMQMVSEHLWECGARVPHTKDGVPRFQKRWWHPPGNRDPHWLTSPGRWLKKPFKPKPGDGPNLVDMLRAMKTADEGNFFGALDELMKGDEK